MGAQQIIEILELEPHPEGGYYRETWRGEAHEGERGAGTAIYYLLRAGERSHWHRVDAVEVWHYYAGAGKTEHLRLGADLAAGECPQAIVPKGAWQSASTCGAWTLVGCTVAPAFDFAGFELAPPAGRPIESLFE
ncbi:MAG: cupin domain-containing protein [Alphaproteobacteria bacterium]|nr:cupin domain-containing protein [Alphaproteobacteria bacterium]